MMSRAKLCFLVGSENVGILERFGERMWNIGQKGALVAT